MVTFGFSTYTDWESWMPNGGLEMAEGHLGGQASSLLLFPSPDTEGKGWIEAWEAWAVMVVGVVAWWVRALSHSSSLIIA